MCLGQACSYKFPRNVLHISVRSSCAASLKDRKATLPTIQMHSCERITSTLSTAVVQRINYRDHGASRVQDKQNDAKETHKRFNNLPAFFAGGLQIPPKNQRISGFPEGCWMCWLRKPKSTQAPAPVAQSPALVRHARHQCVDHALLETESETPTPLSRFWACGKGVFG